MNDTSIIKYVWKFELLSFGNLSEYGHAAEIFLGLRSTKTQPFIPGFTTKTSIPYLFGIVILKDNYYMGGSTHLSNKPAIGDIIEMTLDSKQKELGYKVNDGDYKNLFVHQDLWKSELEWMQEMGFRASISLDIGMSIEFISFSVEYK